VDVGLSGASGRTPSWGWITSTGWGSAGNGHGRVTPGPEAREALKKLAATVDAAKAEALDPAVEVWAFDGHRLGLKLLIRRVWARRGQRPVALSTHKYKWLYLYDFARPEWWLATSVNVPLFKGVRDGFAATVGAGPDKTAIVCSTVRLACRQAALPPRRHPAELPAALHPGPPTRRTPLAARR